MVENIVIVGGGIAGVSCAQALADSCEVHDGYHICLISGKHGHLKSVRNYEKTGIVMEKFDVSYDPAQFIQGRYTKVDVVKENVVHWNPDIQQVQLSDGSTVSYTKLVIATGAKARSLNTMGSDRILTLRDTDTVKTLQDKLKNARKVVIVGDGGIGMELAYELKSTDVIWILKEVSVGTMFFDLETALAIENRFHEGRQHGETKPEAMYDRLCTSKQPSTSANPVIGCALGPYWLAKLDQTEKGPNQKRRLEIRRNSYVIGYDVNEDDEFAVTVKLSNGDSVQCDLVVEAMGVKACSDLWKSECPTVILLGDFMGNESDSQIETVFGEESVVRNVIREDRVVGSCLIGETGCEEMLEQLILTELDVSNCPRPLSNQTGDMADYFD